MGTADDLGTQEKHVAVARLADVPVWRHPNPRVLTSTLGPEVTGSNVDQHLYGHHTTIASASSLSSGSSKTFVAYGNYLWAKVISIASAGTFRFRGRQLNDDGTRDASPSDTTIASPTIGTVYISQARIADNASIDTLDSFMGTIDYGLVSPYNQEGKLNLLETARVMWAPSDNSNWRFDWSVSRFAPGAGGGLTNLLASADATTFQNTDTLKAAAVGFPGNQMVLEINDNFDFREKEGIVVAIRRRNIKYMSMVLTGARVPFDDE